MFMYKKWLTVKRKITEVERTNKNLRKRKCKQESGSGFSI